MKKVLASFLLILASYSGFSQEINPKNQIKLSVGVAPPVGKFAATDMKSSGSGFAKTGVLVDGSYTRFLNKNWGVGFSIVRFSNEMDEVALLTEAENWTRELLLQMLLLGKP